MREFECGNNIYKKTKRVRKPDPGERNPINIICASIPVTPAKSKTYSDNTDIRYHPTQKPLEVMRYLIKTFTDEGDTVLDFTMGAMTTGLAALEQGRRFIGIDTEIEYCEIGIMRASKMGLLT